jgi:2-haloacid dehalogenase
MSTRFIAFWSRNLSSVVLSVSVLMLGGCSDTEAASQVDSPPHVVVLNGEDQPLRADFNHDQGFVRLMLLVDPRCPECLRGLADMGDDVLAKLPKGARIKGYTPAMDKVRKGELPWTSLDDLQRMILEDLLKDYRIEGRLSEEEKIDWAHVWRRLKPWPDSVEGLTRLKNRHIISPMSNGNVALMVHLAKFAGLPWDVVLGSDLVRHYKPDREMYMSAPFYLDLKPEEVMMCAAHVGDLHAARSYGLRTGFIYRPNEYGGGPAGVPDKVKSGDFDLVSESIVDLAQQLGA